MNDETPLIAPHRINAARERVERILTRACVFPDEAPDIHMALAARGRWGDQPYVDDDALADLCLDLCTSNTNK